MKFKIVLPGVVIRQGAIPARVQNPLYLSDTMQAGPDEFAMQIAGVGCFYARDGREVELSTEPGADQGWVKLYLNGQVLVALLHQRKIINFHASSFVHNGRGVMVLGGTGAGKSSLTVAFALNGAMFMTDDLTPVIFRDGSPVIWPLPRAVKLREATVGQLKIESGRLTGAETGTGKQYLHLKHAGEPYPLQVILKIEVGSVQRPEFHEPSPAEKFSLLRSEICLWEILAGMPETEADYLEQLLGMVKQVVIVRAVRPEKIRITEMYAATGRFLQQL